MVKPKTPARRPAGAVPPAPAPAKERAPSQPFPIVGLGASAGGLEALELFVSHVPPDSGMAFVVVQHLDPTHPDLLAELLQRCTPMPVAQVTDRLRVKPGRVYIIPPNKDMSILHGVLHLLAPVAPRGLRLPIDFFLRSLAADQQEHSIGVILSGMGSDGTLGLRAVKERGGLVCVQTPTTAKFDAMPRAAIDAGLADVVAPAEDLPGKIGAYLQHAPSIAAADTPVDRKTQSALEKVMILLRAQTGHDFSLYKTTTLYRRLERRMGLHQIDKLAGYVSFLQANPPEVELLFRELLIGVTSFFRDPEAWAQVQAEVLPALMAGRAAAPPLRAWVPACATGEEAYSLAMAFQETLDELKPARRLNLQIFATDLDAQAIDKARAGLYPLNIATDVSAPRLDRFFTKTDQGYQVAKVIRDMVIFAPQNLIMDPPFTKLDLVSCRNLLIYLTPELQKKLLPLFHYILNPGGYLFLGNAETIGDFAPLFAPLAGKTRLYRRLEPATPRQPLDFPTALGPAVPRAAAPPPKSPPNLQALAEQRLLQAYAPAAALTTAQGDILFISGHTGQYLEPAAGKANWSIFAMARDGLGPELARAFRQAQRHPERQPATVTLPPLTVSTNAGARAVTVTVEPLREPEGLAGMMLIVFTEAAPPGPPGRPARPGRAPALAQDLARATQEAQSLREEMRSSQEELRSTNEEMQSTNEELQSTNEELTTSKEELQSMNEELHTLNQELQTRLDELARANNDLKNLLDSTDIATLFLDGALRVRRFTAETGKVTQLLPGDVGRPVTDIASALLYPELAADAREVLRTLVKTERQIVTADGRWFAARILPYRTLENMIDGVVITFTDITAAKELEQKLRGPGGAA